MVARRWIGSAIVFVVALLPALGTVAPVARATTSAMTPAPLSIAAVAPTPRPARGSPFSTRDRLLHGVEAVASLACGDPTHCVGVGHGGGTAGVVTTATGGRSWSTRGLPYGISSLSDVTCPSRDRCLATGMWQRGGGVVVRSEDGGVTWRSVSPAPTDVYELDGIACPTAKECVAVGDGFSGAAVAIRSTDAGRTWTLRPSPWAGRLDHLASVTCASAQRCFALGSAPAGASRVLETGDAGANWHLASPFGAGTAIGALACHGHRFCVAVGGTGASVAYVTTDAGRSWTHHWINGWRLGPLTAVSCATQQDCTAINAVAVYRTTDGGRTWRSQYLPDFLTADAIACPSVAVCAAGGAALTIGAQLPAVAVTTDAGRRWSLHAAGSPATALSAIVCPGRRRCVAVGGHGAGGTSTGLVLATADGRTWKAQKLPRGTSALSAISCPTVEDCVAVGDGTARLSIVLTTDAGGVWRRIPVERRDALLAVSCPTTSTCFAVGDLGATARFLVTTDGGTRWSDRTLPSVVRHGAGLACPTVTMCVVVGESDAATPIIVRTTDRGATWTEPPVSGPHPADGSGSELRARHGVLSAVTCRTAIDCAAVGSVERANDPFDTTGMVITSPDAGRTWGAQTLPERTGPLGAISCTPQGHCVAGASCPSGCEAFGRPAPGPLVTRPPVSSTWSLSRVDDFVGAVTSLAHAPGGRLWAIAETPQHVEILEAIGAASL